MSLTIPQPSVDVSHRRPDEAVAAAVAAIVATAADVVVSTVDVIIAKIASRFMSRVAFHHDLSPLLPSRRPFRDSVSN